MLVSLTERRASPLVGCASLFTCIAILSLLLASALPMWVVTSFRGNARVLLAEVKVDLAVGEGLYVKNWCFGATQPDEGLLHAVGLTCEGERQTEACEREDLTAKQEDHCERFYVMQGTESLAVFAAFVGSLLLSLSRTCETRAAPFKAAFRLGAVGMLAVALAATAAVVSLVKESDMARGEETFACSYVMGAELCHGWGASLWLQGMAAFNLTLALCCALLSIFARGTETTTMQFVRVPLISNQQQGVVLARPVPQAHAYYPVDFQQAAEAI